METTQQASEPQNIPFSQKWLSRQQPCGCLVCICEDDERCHGCGAKHCGTHPVGAIPNPVYEMRPVPDFGEPWKFSRGEPSIESREDDAVLTGIDYEFDDAKIQRAVACVNACAGMADPAREIARLQNCSEELDSILSVIPEDAPCHHAETGETVADYILDLQKEVGRVHALYFNTSQQLEAMRDAIQEAATAFQFIASNWTERDLKPGETIRQVFHAEKIHEANAAIAKLQPFLPKP